VLGVPLHLHIFDNPGSRLTGSCHTGAVKKLVEKGKSGTIGVSSV